MFSSPTLPPGGYSFSTSSLSLGGYVFSSPTLPLGGYLFSSPTLPLGGYVFSGIGALGLYSLRFHHFALIRSLGRVSRLSRFFIFLILDEVVDDLG